MYTIVDLEATGGKFNEESIIEIAIYKFDGVSITDQFISLVNPEKEIHPYVEKLTGISTKMLKTAPRFHEIAKRVIEITSDSVLVAHNAQFDYRILQLEFKRLGFDFSMKSFDLEDSFSLSIFAITFPTSITSFGLAKISTMTPSAEEGISESTLSVPISNKISSIAIESPTCFFHSKIVPSVMDSPILGITTSIII